MAKVKNNTETPKTGQAPGAPPKRNEGEGKAPAERKPENPTIEELGAKLDPAVMAGVCAREKWRPGKRVSEKDFKKAVDDFGRSPISGKAPEQPDQEKQEASE